MKIEIKIGSASRTFTTRSGAAYVSLGSRADNDLVIDAPGVSPLHLKFEHFMNRWTFTDQMSDTGTKHNGETAYSGELAEGDRVEVGGAVLKIVDLLTELDIAQKASRIADRSWQDEVKPSAGKPTAGYKREVEGSYSVEAERGYSSGDSSGYAVSRDDSSGYHRGTNHARPQPKTRERKAKSTAPFVALIVAVIVAGGVAFGIFSAGGSGDPSSGAYGAGGDDSGVQAGDPDRMPSVMEKELQRELERLIAKSNETPPYVKYLVYEKLKQEIEAYKRHNLRHVLERTYTALRVEVYREMQVRYSRDNGQIYNLQQEKQFKLAIGRLAELKVYLEQSDLHRELAKGGEMDQYVERKMPELLDDNKWYIGECYTAVDEAMQRNDLEPALAKMKELRENAQLEPEHARNVASEIIALIGMVTKQQRSGLPKRRDPFDRRKDKLPPAPTSTLLPKGDASSYTAMNALKSRLEKAWRAGELDNAECTYYGRPAVLLPKGEDWRMVLSVVHDHLNDQSTKYPVRSAQHNLPPETMISLYEKIEPTPDELLAMLLICFNEGLKDDAWRIALKLWKADETVKSDLDQLLAAKFSIEVPEGGFIEKDGRLVAE